MALICGNITSQDVARVGAIESPVYFYDESVARGNCRTIKGMPAPFGLRPLYAAKAMTTRALVQIIHSEGFGFDTGSLDEVERVSSAGVPFSDIVLTSNDVPRGDDLSYLGRALSEGLTYTICSLEQMRNVARVASRNSSLAMRVNTGIPGGGESSTRSVADQYAPFGTPVLDIAQALEIAREHNLIIRGVHTHVGSGGSPEKWRHNANKALWFVEHTFPDAVDVNFGGGIKIGRMPGKQGADVLALGEYTAAGLTDLYRRTRRKIRMTVEPGTFVMGNAGLAVFRVVDVKRTGETESTRQTVVMIDGVMNVNSRVLYYGADHPFYAVSSEGELLSSEFDQNVGGLSPVIIHGTNCESGDGGRLDEKEKNHVPVRIALPRIGDFVAMGGCGAYCSTMTPKNYLSRPEAGEFLKRSDGTIVRIRTRQTREQIRQNELDLRNAIEI